MKDSDFLDSRNLTFCTSTNQEVSQRVVQVSVNPKTGKIETKQCSVKESAIEFIKEQPYFKG